MNCSQTTGERLASSKASHGLVTSGHYLFIPFLKTKVKWVRRKIGQAENCIKDQQDSYICHNLLLRAINNGFLKSAWGNRVSEMITLRYILEAEVRHQQRERERERDKTWTRKRRKGTLTEREKETGISSMIGFDTATSSFLTLLINKSYRK